MIQLTAEQVYFLKIFNSYKSFARRDNFVQDQRYNKVQISKSYDELAEECLKLGLLKKNVKGSYSLKLTWQEVCNLIAFQTDTQDDLLAQIEQQRQHIVGYNETIERLAPINPPWPSNDHFALQAARESKDYSLKTIANLNERLKMVRAKV
jgi:hypothetical protein